jgi:hypothetical protein
MPDTNHVLPGHDIPIWNNQRLIVTSATPSAVASRSWHGSHMIKKRHETAGATTMSDERRCRWAMLSAIRRLRQSVEKGRPISLPNVLRLFQRRCAGLNGGNVQAYGRRRIEKMYRRQQPFKEAQWRSWREDVRRASFSIDR